jgi:hypothetical protein
VIVGDYSIMVTLRVVLIGSAKLVGLIIKEIFDEETGEIIGVVVSVLCILVVETY